MTCIAFATCLKFLDMQPGDALLAGELARRDVAVRAAPWNGDFAPFAQADLVLVRSTWDYPEHAAAFRGWIARCADAGLRLFNPAALMAWNLSKDYLLDLAARGAPLPPTRAVDPVAGSIAAAMDALGLAEAVVKPLVGATARGLSRVRRDDAAGLDRAAAVLGQRGLVQPVVAEIAERGETSFVFFAGRYSHGVVKRPAAGDIRSQREFGGRVEPANPPAWAVAEARRVLSLLPEAPLYARIDAVLLDARLALMEVELIEPELFLTHDEGAAGRLADVLVAKLKA